MTPTTGMAPFLLSTVHDPHTLAVQADIHDAMLDLHVPAQIALEVELAGAVGALEGLAARMQVHVAQQVVHAIEGLPAHLGHIEAAHISWGEHAPTSLAGPDPHSPFFPMWPQRQRNSHCSWLLQEAE